MTKILFNDGEGVEFADFNLQRDLHLKLIIDQLLANMAGPNVVPWDQLNAGESQLRPFRHAGAFYQISGNTSTIRINGGLWLQLDYSGVFSADGPIGLLAHGDMTELGGFVPAASGMYRRDIIQARVVEVNESPVSRDYKDAVTGALTTTSVVKRSNHTVQIQRKAGTTEYATTNDADDPANEVAADSGWFKIGSVRVSDTGLSSYINSAHWDWRKPWGFSFAQARGNDFYRDNGILMGGGGEHVIGDATYLLGTDCPFEKAFGNAANLWCPVRISKVEMLSDYNAAPISTTTRLSRYGTSGFDAHLYDVGAVGTSFGWDTLFADDEGATKPPLWANGRTTAYNASHRDYLRAFINTPSGASDLIYAFTWAGWGGC